MNGEIVREWLAVVDEDLLAASHCLRGQPPVPKRAAFFVQQSAEKLIKAILVAWDLRPPRTHDIAELLDFIPEAHPDRPSLARLQRFTRYAVVFRYPLEEVDAEPVPDTAEIDGWITEIRTLKAGFEAWLDRQNRSRE